MDIKNEYLEFKSGLLSKTARKVFKAFKNLTEEKIETLS